jgi:hypothetical protein
MANYKLARASAKAQDGLMGIDELVQAATKLAYALNCPPGAPNEIDHNMTDDEYNDWIAWFNAHPNGQAHGATILNAFEELCEALQENDFADMGY